MDNITDSDPSESCQISFEQRPQYLYVYVSGDEDSYEISSHYWREIAAECRKTNYKKVLVEEDISMVIPMTEMYRLAAEIPKMGFHGIRMAFVDRFGEHQEANEFGELVATNRGIYGRIFNNFEEAEKWLLAG